MCVCVSKRTRPRGGWGGGGGWKNVLVGDLAGFEVTVETVAEGLITGVTAFGPDDV